MMRPMYCPIGILLVSKKFADRTPAKVQQKVSRSNPRLQCDAV